VAVQRGTREVWGNPSDNRRGEGQGGRRENRNRFPGKKVYHDFQENSELPRGCDETIRLTFTGLVCTTARDTALEEGRHGKHDLQTD